MDERQYDSRHRYQNYRHCETPQNLETTQHYHSSRHDETGHYYEEIQDYQDSRHYENSQDYQTNRQYQGDKSEQTYRSKETDQYNETVQSSREDTDSDGNQSNDRYANHRKHCNKSHTHDNRNTTHEVCSRESWTQAKVFLTKKIDQDYTQHYPIESLALPFQTVSIAITPLVQQQCKMQQGRRENIGDVPTIEPEGLHMEKHLYHELIQRKLCMKANSQNIFMNQPKSSAIIDCISPIQHKLPNVQQIVNLLWQILDPPAAELFKSTFI